MYESAKAYISGGEFTCENDEAMKMYDSSVAYISGGEIRGGDGVGIEMNDFATAYISGGNVNGLQIGEFQPCPYLRRDVLRRRPRLSRGARARRTSRAANST